MKSNWQSYALAIASGLLVGVTGLTVGEWGQSDFGTSGDGPDGRFASRAGDVAMAVRTLTGQYGILTDDQLKTPRLSDILQILDSTPGLAASTQVTADSAVSMVSRADLPAILMLHNTLSVWLGTAVDSYGNFYARILDKSQGVSLVPITSITEIRNHKVWYSSNNESGKHPVSVSIRGEPVLTADKLYHDFGIMDFDGSKEVDFHLTNAGDEDIVLGDMYPSCGCVEMKNAFRSKSLAPGESAEIAASVSFGASVSLNENITLTVMRSDGSIPFTLQLRLFGSRFNSASWNPTSLDFGVIGQDGSNSPGRRIRIQETVWDRFEIEHIDCAGQNEFDFRVYREPTGKGLTTWNTDVVLRSPRQAVSERGTIVVRTTSTVRPNISIPYRIDVDSRLDFDPPSIAFGLVELNSIGERQVVVRAGNEQESVAVEVLEAPAGCHVQVNNSGTMATLNVTQSFAVSGPFSEQLRLRTQLGTGDPEFRTIPISSFVRAASNSSPSPQ